MCLDAYVVSQLFQIVVVQGSVYDTYVLACIVDSVITEDDLIGNQPDGVVAESVACVQALDAQTAVGDYLTCEIDAAKRSVESQVSCCPHIDIAHETAAETLQEFSTRVVGADI